MSGTRRPGSLRLRLLAVTWVTVLLALVGAYGWLSNLFRAEVLRQLDATLVQQLDQLSARLEFGESGAPLVDPRRLSDPRWDKPYSGLYWQLEQLSDDRTTRTVRLRSRSLWDAQLELESGPSVAGDLRALEAKGPKGEVVRVIERPLRFGMRPQEDWRLIVAVDTQDALGAIRNFDGVLSGALGALGLLLALAALAQVFVGLAPLKSVQVAVQRLREGRTQRVEGRFPSEVQPLIDDLNAVLDHNAEVVTRSRTQAGNLAHGLKTPLAVLQNAAQQAAPAELGALLLEQVEAAQRQIQWHLSQARAAASGPLPGQRTPVGPVLTRLQRVMEKIHADRELLFTVDSGPPAICFAGEEQDLQEMLGNLLDNACASAKSRVLVSVRFAMGVLHIVVEDDGRGIEPELRAAVLQRGVRLDESRPGSGLGLAIVEELAQRYGGMLRLDASPAGGLRALLTLPALDGA